MNRRLIAVLLIIVIAIIPSFAGGNKESKAGTDDNKLVVAIQTHSMVSDYDENYQTQYIEELLGIEIEFYELPARENVGTNVSLLAASSSNLPDVLLTDALTAETILSYGESGVFVAIDEYVDNPELLPNFNALPEDARNTILETIKMANGHMYSFVRYEPEVWNYTPYRMFINGAWLDKLGLEVPTTTDELKEVLIAFRDNDPNGNGIKDEIGVYGFQAGRYGQNTIAALMNSFVYYNDQLFNYGLELAPDGETVYAPFTSDGWREGLKYMNDLYNEGLLAPSIFTDADSQFKARLNEENNVVGFVSAGSLSNWPDAANNENYLEMELIQPLAGPDGIRYTPYNLFRPSQVGFIFEGTDKVELALKFLDAFYDPYTALVARFGEENVDWTRDPEVLSTLSNAYVEAGIYDSVYVADITQCWYTIGNRNWHAINPRYADEYQVNSTAVANQLYNPDDPTQLHAKNYEWYVPCHPEKVLPPLYYTIEEIDQIQEAILNIPSYVTQTIAEFVTGARNPQSDADWNRYLSELENMGLSRWLEISQVAYERI